MQGCKHFPADYVRDWPINRELIAQLRSYTVAQLHSYTVAQLHSYTVTQLRNYTDTQVSMFRCTSGGVTDQVQRSSHGSGKGNSILHANHQGSSSNVSNYISGDHKDDEHSDELDLNNAIAETQKLRRKYKMVKALFYEAETKLNKVKEEQEKSLKALQTSMDNTRSDIQTQTLMQIQELKDSHQQQIQEMEGRNKELEDKNSHQNILISNLYKKISAMENDIVLIREHYHAEIAKMSDEQEEKLQHELQKKEEMFEQQRFKSLQRSLSAESELEKLRRVLIDSDQAKNKEYLGLQQRYDALASEYSQVIKHSEAVKAQVENLEQIVAELEAMASSRKSLEVMLQEKDKLIEKLRCDLRVRNDLGSPHSGGYLDGVISKELGIVQVLHCLHSKNAGNADVLNFHRESGATTGDFADGFSRAGVCCLALTKHKLRF